MANLLNLAEQINLALGQKGYVASKLRQSLAAIGTLWSKKLENNRANN